MTTVYKKTEHVATRRVGGETILVPISGRLADLEKVYVLNEVGEYIWEQLDGSRDVRHISAGVADEFDADGLREHDECLAFVRELVREGLITEVRS